MEGQRSLAPGGHCGSAQGHGGGGSLEGVWTRPWSFLTTGSARGAASRPSRPAPPSPAASAAPPRPSSGPPRRLPLWRHGLELGLRGAAAWPRARSTRPRAQRVHGRRRRARCGGVRASASGLPFSPSSPTPSISLSCGCRIRLRGAVTRRLELGPAAGPRGARRGARSLGPALRGTGGAWPRSAAARSGPRGGWARPAAGLCVAGWTGTIFFYDVATLSCLLLVRKS